MYNKLQGEGKKYAQYVSQTFPIIRFVTDIFQERYDPY